MDCGSCGTFLQVICDVATVITPQNSSKTRKIHAQKYKKDTKPQEPGECVTHDSSIVQVCALGMLTNTNNSQRQPTQLWSGTSIICETDALHRHLMPPPIIYAFNATSHLIRYQANCVLIALPVAWGRPQPLQGWF